jgi:hypothetical protein
MAGDFTTAQLLSSRQCAEAGFKVEDAAVLRSAVDLYILVANMQSFLRPILLLMGAVSIYGDQALTTAPIPPLKTPPLISLATYYLERVDISPGGSMFGLKEVVARRSDGAIVRIGALRPGDILAFGREVTFPDGTRVTIYDSVKAKTTWLPDPVQARFFRAQATEGATECTMGGNTPLRREQMEGQDVDVVQFSANNRRVTVRRAPKLGCEYLYDKAEVRERDGSFRIDMEIKTTKLVIGEPDASLFEVAPDLVEMKPSETLRKLWSSVDPPVPAEQKQAFLREEERLGAELDKRYEAAKSKARQ